MKIDIIKSIIYILDKKIKLFYIYLFIFNAK